MIPLIIYIVIFVAAFFIVTKVVQGAGLKDYTSLKTVTFGDESAVRPNRAAGDACRVGSSFQFWSN